MEEYTEDHSKESQQMNGKIKNLTYVEIEVILMGSLFWQELIHACVSSLLAALWIVMTKIWIFWYALILALA